MKRHFWTDRLYFDPSGVLPPRRFIVAPADELNLFISQAQEMPRPVSALEVWRNALANVGPMGRLLIIARDRVNQMIGGNRMGLLDRMSPKTPVQGDRLLGFTVGMINDHVLTLTADDPHHEGMICIAMSPDLLWATLTVSAKARTRRGRLMVFVFGPLFHRLVIAAAARIR